ncbi:putative pectin lyase E [Xylariaceae sp. FL1651]|nr:putative pectin lyase E [Xylariaceae sp. FL1651]
MMFLFHAKEKRCSQVTGIMPIAAPRTPTTIAQLKTYLTSTSPHVMIISGTFVFNGFEGSVSYSACNVYCALPSGGGQALLNTLDGCGSNPTYTVTLDKAGVEGIQNGATLKGKGLSSPGSSNVVVQNIAITGLNPQYIWIDHIHTSSLGRQHYSFGTSASNGINISNSFLGGRTSYSASCDGHTYWGLELVGSGDLITFYKNYIYYTSGRSPALSGNIHFHAVNNVWSSITTIRRQLLLNVPTILGQFSGRMITSDTASQCAVYLGRNCVANLRSNSGAFSKDDAVILQLFSGRGSIAPAASASSITTIVPAAAGNTL